VYNTLVSTVNDNLPLLHRYQQIRKDALRLSDGVHAYDLFAPFVKEQSMTYPYDDACQHDRGRARPVGR
jgi:oligoendopeptidase F